MPFSRRKHSQRGKHSDKGRDPFHHLADERQDAESSTWFLEPDDGPDLEVQAGVSSNLRDDDLDDPEDR
jgi:hypothetical protein